MKIKVLLMVLFFAGFVTAQYTLDTPSCYYDEKSQVCAGACDKGLYCLEYSPGKCTCTTYERVTTTTLAYCGSMTSVKGQRECDLGDCPNGGSCTFVPLTDSYGYCTCGGNQGQTPSCYYDKDKRGCVGECAKGMACIQTGGYSCSCQYQRTATTTTTATTIRRLNAGDLLGGYTTTTTLIMVRPTITIPTTTFTLPVATLADSDHDGVPNLMDDCPGTPIGVAVNSRGCPLCSDSDASSDSPHYTQGSVQVPSAQPSSPMDEYATILNVTFDTCANETHLLERYCDGNGSMKTEAFKCPQGCYLGACQCTETDGGLNYDVQGVHGGKKDESNINKVSAANMASVLKGGAFKMYAVNPAVLTDNKTTTLSPTGLGSFYSITPIHASDKPVNVAGAASAVASLDDSVMGNIGAILSAPVAEYCADENTLVEYYPEVKNDKCTYKTQNHVCPQGCRLGRCMPSTIYNEKNATLFEGKQAFMISDFDWRSGLRAVPLATWDYILDLDSIGGVPFTFNFDLTFPLLYYHRESSTAWDADAVIHILQLYAPDKLTIFTSGEGVPANLQAVLTADSATSQNTIRNNPMGYSGPGLHANQLVAKPMSDYYGYWSTINSVVVSQDDYSTGMLAAVWASHLNAPLLFDGHFNKNVLNGRYVITVGDISADTMDAINDRGKLYHAYTKRQMQETLVSTYNANRVILVNPNDWSAW